MPLVNAKQIIQKAVKRHYAVPHININNLEWTKAILETAQAMDSPIILGTSEGAINYMGGYQTVFNLVSGLVEDLAIKVPVVLHLDHGSYEAAKLAINMGWTSVMFDGSNLPFEENLHLSKEIVKLAEHQGVSVEVEVGSIGGEEDGVIGTGELADPDQVAQMAHIGADMIAAGINNIHGRYPSDWKGLDFKTLELLKSKADGKALVLHGGSEIPNDQIKAAIKLGIAKVNVNTELQIANALAIEQFVLQGQVKVGRNYDPRKLLKPGYEAIKKVVQDKITLFGSQRKA